MCAFLPRPLLYPYRGGRTRVLNTEYETDRDDFTDWMYFLPFNLPEEISPNPETLSVKKLYSVWNS